MLSVRPSDGADAVAIGAQINVDLELPNGGLSLTSVTEQSVRLIGASGDLVPATVTAVDDSQTLTLEPVNNLAFGTTYRFEITEGVEDESGQAFTPFSSTFSTTAEDVPAITLSRPADGERDVPVDTGIATDLNLPNSGVDATTISDSTVYLTEQASGQQVAGTPGTTGGRDSITFQPAAPLAPLTAYQFTITSAVTDENGAAFAPYTSTFTTGSAGAGGEGNISLVPQPTAARERHSSLAFGPDRLLYATTIDGRIKRYPVGADGTLGTPQTITSLQQAEGGPRLTVGLAFDPASTADNLVVFVTHTELDSFDGKVDNGVDAPWAGKLTRLSGPNLENV